MRTIHRHELDRGRCFRRERLHEARIIGEAKILLQKSRDTDSGGDRCAGLVALELVQLGETVGSDPPVAGRIDGKHRERSRLFGEHLAAFGSDLAETSRLMAGLVHILEQPGVIRE
jgi:hypothetical protein